MKYFTFNLFHHKLWNGLDYQVLYLKSSLYSYWLLSRKFEWLWIWLSYIKHYSIYKLYQDPTKGNINCRFCHNCNSYNFHIHKTLCFLNVLSIHDNYIPKFGSFENLVDKPTFKVWHGYIPEFGVNAAPVDKQVSNCSEAPVDNSTSDLRIWAWLLYPEFEAIEVPVQKFSIFGGLAEGEFFYNQRPHLFLNNLTLFSMVNWWKLNNSCQVSQPADVAQFTIHF